MKLPTLATVVTLGVICTSQAFADETNSGRISLGVYTSDTSFVLYQSDGTEERYFGPPRVSLSTESGIDVREEIKDTLPISTTWKWDSEFMDLPGQSMIDLTDPERLYTWTRTIP